MNKCQTNGKKNSTRTILSCARGPKAGTGPGGCKSEQVTPLANSNKLDCFDCYDLYLDKFVCYIEGNAPFSLGSPALRSFENHFLDLIFLMGDFIHHTVVTFVLPLIWGSEDEEDKDCK